MVDTVYINLRKNSIDKTQLMILDMLANFDWKRPLYMTQVYILQDFGLMDYLQFDGYAYRFVPILTPVQNPWEIGRIDADYAAPLLKETFRYGNLADPRVYADYFIQYNLSASHARDAFARVAKELLRQDRAQEAVELLDMGLEKLPPSQIRFTDSNTYPFLEAYYAASAMGVEDAADKGDALLREYARTLIEYIEYYLRFDGVQGDMVSPIIDEKLDQLGDVYYLAVYAGRKGNHRRDQRLLPFARGRRGEPRGCGRQAPPGRYDPYPAQRHRAIATTTDKGESPSFAEGLFPILRIRGFRAETVQLQQPKPPHPSPGTRRKKTGNPRLGGFPAVKTVSAATGSFFSDASSRTVSCQAVLARFLYDDKDRQIPR